MTSTDLPGELRNWAVSELLALSNRIANVSFMPSTSSLEKICCGKNKLIWRYLLEHVVSRSSAYKIRNELDSYRSNLINPITVLDLLHKEKQLQSRLSTLAGRTSFLESQVDEAEEKLNSTNVKIQQLCQKTVEEQKFFGFLLCSSYSFGDKGKYFKLLSKDIDSSIQILGNICDPLGEQKKFSILSKNLRTIGYLDQSLNCIKETFNKVLRANSSDFHDIKKGIWEKIETVFDSFSAFDVICYLQDQCQLSTEMIEKLENQSIEELCQFDVHQMPETTINCLFKPITSAELEQQKIEHISEYMECIKSKNHLLTLLKQIDQFLVIIKQQFGTYDANEEFTTICITLLSKESDCHGLMLGIQQLKSVISDFEAKSKDIQKRIDEEISQTFEIYHYQSLIISKRNAMCEFLKQNGKLICRSSNKLSNMRDDIIEHFNLGTSTINNAKENLKSGLQKELKLFHVIKKKYLQKSNCIYSVSNEVVYRDLIEIFNVLLFESQSTLIQHCMSKISNILSLNVRLKKQENALLEMESSKLSLNLNTNTDLCSSVFKTGRNTLLEASKLIDDKIKQLKAKEGVLVEIRQLLIDWWDQPAQFAYPIQYENHTLKEWLDLLMMLLQL